MEEELTAGLGEREIAQFIHDDEVEPGDEVGKTALLTIARFRLKTIDEINDVIEAPACTVTDQGAGKCDGQVRFSSASSADKNDVVLLSKESSGCEVAHQAFIDRGAGKGKVVDILGQRQLCYGDLVFNRERLFLGDLRLQ